MKLHEIVNLNKWHKRKVSVGYVGHGTRDKIVLKQTMMGKVYFLAKTYDKNIGELRSEVCASSLGKLFGFPVQKTWLCVIPQHRSLGLRHKFGVLIQLDIRRQRYTKRGQFREDLLHGADLMSQIDKGFAKAKDLKEKRKLYTLDLAIKAIRNYVSKHKGSKIVWEQFFELLVFDALIGGTDRHYYNWGVLEIADNGKFLRLAPAFDNGVSLMWKMEEYRSQFFQDLLSQNFTRRAEAMFKKPNGGKYTLFDVLEELYKIKEYRETKLADKILKRISKITEVRIKYTLYKIPQVKDFKTSKKELDVVILYAMARLEILKEILYKLGQKYE